jgi:hypothetical protein
MAHQTCDYSQYVVVYIQVMCLSPTNTRSCTLKVVMWISVASRRLSATGAMLQVLPRLPSTTLTWVLFSGSDVGGSESESATSLQGCASLKGSIHDKRLPLSTSHETHPALQDPRLPSAERAARRTNNNQRECDCVCHHELCGK